MKRLLMMMAAVISLSGCVTVVNEKPVTVSGAAGFLEKIRLPQDARITIAIIDANTRGQILAQKSFNVAVNAVPFKFTLKPEVIDKKANYVVVSHISSAAGILFQTYDEYPVINNGLYTTEVIMKPARKR
ncbi:YbaY family lipoprotein [Paraferrimonas sp. SM1919]|uniref:YbaY family lipoprotein n=1 Tax=Paraferrimonas sp. SM1919 TaxID=2662263 RepID=UPI0013D0F956|nr:YbaY family lipoprotein [Paraferrimonas sp. SM1919]